MRKISTLFFITFTFFSQLGAQEVDANQQDEVFLTVEEMPIFPGCDSFSASEEIIQCTNHAISLYIQSVLQIPEKYDVNGINDVIYIRMVINELGETEKIEVIKDAKLSDEELRLAAIQAVSQLPQLIPAKNQGNPVKVRYHVPVRFKKDKHEKFTIVENMPIWIGCEEEETRQDITRCTNNKIFDYVSNESSKINATLSGTVMVRFVVNEEGMINDVSILKGMPEAPELDSLAKEIVLSIPPMIPGTQKGEPVNVQYNIPVIFKRGDGKAEKYLSPNAIYDLHNAPISIQREFRERGISTQGADRMPIWNGCHLKGTKETEDDCTEWRILRFVRKNVIYPESLKKEKPLGTVVVIFEVGSNGDVEVHEVLPNPENSAYPEMREEAIRVVSSMPRFIPAQQGGKPISYKLSVAVPFKY